MKEDQVFDRPLEDPDDDLLGMKEYPSRLAEFIREIQPPFTIGVYGEWGSGKTSFVRFLEYYLARTTAQERALPFKFIKFTAWPHRTSDELWRALILTIAQALYDVPAVPSPPLAASTPGRDRPARPLSWLAEFLHKDAAVLRDATPPADERADYNALLARLDQTPYGTITKDSEQRFRLDQEETALAIAKAALAALGTLSPLIAGLRTLFGLGGEVDLGAVLRREKNEAVRQRIQSVADFRQVFGELFEQRAKDKRVCVFVDDLDRCMPDVALDLLEAIKIFLGEAPCIFIVAADEHLIGQGLLLRFRDLLERDAPVQMQSFFAQKGQEYFEKIIQLRIHVPARTPEQTYAFIAAQFPRWLPAMDLIQTAIGDNPRRLKQYCNWLNFRHLVSEPGSGAPALDPPVRTLLEKIITLQAWSLASLDALRALASVPDTYAKTVQKVEKCLLESANDQPIPDAHALLPDVASRTLYDQAVVSAPLLALFRNAPLFSEAPPGQVAALGLFADLQPDPKSVLQTRDAPFLRILQYLLQTGSISQRKLLQDDLARLIALWREFPGIAAPMSDLAQAGSWADEMQAVEAAAEKILQGQFDEGENLGAPARTVIQPVLDLVKASGGTDKPARMRALLLDAPRLSTLLREEVLGFRQIKDSLPAAQDLLSPEAGEVSDMVKDQQVASEVLKRDRLPASLRAAINDALAMRIAVAQHLLALRRFAKLDALERRWPQLAYWLRTARATSDLVMVLEQSEQARSLSPEWTQRLERCRQDEPLTRFLPLRPHWHEIPPKERQDFFKVSQSVSPPPSAAPAAVFPASVAAEAAALKPEAVAKAAPAAPAELAAKQPRPAYQDVNIIIAPVPSADGKPPADGKHKFSISLSGPSVTQPIALVEISLDLAALVREIDEIERVPRSVDPGPVTREIPPVPFPDLPRKLSDLGTKLYEAFFQGDVREALETLFRGDAPLRIFLETKDPKLQVVPWECLYLQDRRAFVGLTPKYSLLRYLGAAQPLAVRPVVQPLRMLVVLPTPSNLPPLGSEQEEAILNRTLAAAVEHGQVALKFLRGPEASLEGLQRTLRVFRPHVFHFVGHGVFDQQRQEGALVFQRDNNDANIVAATHVATLLRESMINIAVLNGCDTGRGSSNDSFSSLAGSLLMAGVPAVVATMRVVEDQAALLFTREFYRSIADGDALEAAVIEARKALSVEKWNWSAYALFLGARTGLDSLRLMTEAGPSAPRT